jgi:hypothetical protein
LRKFPLNNLILIGAINNFKQAHPKMNKLLLLLTALILSTQAVGQESTPDLKCRNGGALVIGSWHKLDLCVQHKQMSEAEVLEARLSITRVYPKINREISSSNP